MDNKNTNSSSIQTFLFKNLEEFVGEVNKRASCKADELATSKCTEVELQIPLFQRDLSWDQSLISEFKASYEDQETFLGTIVLLESPQLQESSCKKKFIVIDGQQRLSALFTSDFNDPALQKGIKISIDGLKTEYVSYSREFFAWKDGETEVQEVSFLSLGIKNAKFNWVVYSSDYSNAEQIFEKINVDSKELSTFDTFKAYCIRNGIIPTEGTFWKNLKNSVALQLIGDNTGFSKEKDKYEKDPEGWLFSTGPGFEFDEEDFEWRLRQLLAIACFAANPQEKKYYLAEKRDCKSNDALKEKWKESATNQKNLKNIFDKFEKIQNGVKEKDLLIRRPNIELADTHARNPLLFDFQVYSMAYDYWISSNNCAYLFKNFVEHSDSGETNEVEICKKTIEDLYAEDFLQNATGSLEELKKVLRPLTRLVEIKKLKLAKRPSRRELWISDWLLLYCLTQHNEIHGAFLNAWNKANDIINIFEDQKSDGNKIFEEPRSIYGQDGSLKGGIPSYCDQVEHWVAQENHQNATPQFLNWFGNLCLIPGSDNASLSNQPIDGKTNYIEKYCRDLSRYYLPKLVFTSLVTKQRKPGTSVDDLIIFLTIFWAHFLTDDEFALCEKAKKI